MLGATTLLFGGSRGDDQFCVPVNGRKNQNQRKEAQEESESEDSGSRSRLFFASDSESRDLDDSSSYCSITAPSSCPSVDPDGIIDGNIERFLETITPLVTAQFFSKTTLRDWKTCDDEYQAYFSLSDLWESYREWSAYGAGVPLVLRQRQSVVQYYVPYLSAIQLYGQSAKKYSPKPRYTSEDSDGDYYRDSSSDGSSDFEFGKRTELFPEKRGSQYWTSDISFQMSRLSVNEKHNAMQEGFSSDESESRFAQDLLFEYFDQDPPFSREPLADKILDLACLYPNLSSLRSCDLFPSSWMAVAWYPIYRIPAGPTLKDLEACFLTYHSLHTPLDGSGGNQPPILVYPSEMEMYGKPKICLPTFAMASYKLKGSVWHPNGVSENQLTNSLLQAADNWLRQLKVHHPDYQFFVSSGTCRR